MASINGITIKNIKKFRGHEGEPLAQGDVYYKGKKLGFWSQDAWGGPDNYGFNENILSEEVKSFKNSDMVEEKYRHITTLDNLLYEVLALIDDEKTYKKAVKLGHKTYVCITDGFHVIGYYCSESDRNKILTSKFHEAYIAKYKKEFFIDAEIKTKIYTDIEDFNIVTG